LQSIAEARISIDNRTSVWNNITDKINAPKKSNLRKLIFGAAAAACIALALMTIPFAKSEFKNDGEMVVNNSEETSEYVLPDNSYTYLDSKSSIHFNKNTFEKNRTLELKGQAFFDVEKGSSFIVKTQYGEVKVLGTSFNVAEESNNLTVTCYTGKVEVNYKGKSVVLLPNEKSDFNLSFYKVPIVLKDEMPMWVGGLIKFENASLANVIKEIENIYSIEITIAENILKDQKYTGAIVKNNIEKAMTSLTWPLHLSYSLEGNQVTIEKIEK
jgi:transmembrane sensor